MTEMTYTRLGNSGLVTSRLCLGTMTFTLGSDFIPGVAAVGQDDANRMIDMAIDSGVNFFDSADGYSQGDAEKMLGIALRNQRKNAVICTKIGFRQSDAITDAGLSRRQIFHQLEACLGRLNTDYIDLLIVHKTDFTTPMEETLNALNDAVCSGKVRYIGCSNWPAWEMARAIQFQKDHGMAQFIAGQYLYNAVARDIEVDVLPLCANMGASLMAWSPLAAGLLTAKYNLGNLAAEGGRISEGDFLNVDKAQAAHAITALEEIAAKYKASPAQVAIAWILHRNKNHTVIIGANKISQLETSLSAAQISLTKDDMSLIGSAAHPTRRYPEWFSDMMRDQAHSVALD